ncbi:hypothetical protein [Haloarcula sediminis]|uniref:hypothetical protein n=1 Tax=Haloarcula sediminis TaxID=3111777 RepID=UPI002D76D267|nr:hypothetical protein [Haloarcula sp. CK38]
MTLLSEDETEFIDLVLAAGDRALERDTFEFMIQDGVPADAFIDSYRDYTLGEVLESLDEKGLAYTDSQEEIIHYNGGAFRRGEVEKIKWEDTGFRKIDRQYIYFTAELKELYQEKGEA